ncbi:Uncharacterized protein Fot_43065 [Forsythia ovata]|uniref:Uncharacterized protein n=1 Tax=Forsythia ovata TaxID=205694 RepID=A0ABD1RPS9_9LAMI
MAHPNNLLLNRIATTNPCATATATARCYGAFNYPLSATVVSLDFTGRALGISPSGKGEGGYRAQRGGMQGSNPEILDLCPVASRSYQMVNSQGLSINFPPWLLGGTSCDLPPPPKA